MNLFLKQNWELLTTLLFALLLSFQVKVSLVIGGGELISGLTPYSPDSLMVSRTLQTWSLTDQLGALWLSWGIHPVLISLIFSSIIQVGFAALIFSFLRIAGASPIWSMALAMFSTLGANPIQLLLRTDYPILLGTRYTHGELALVLAMAAFYFAVTNRFVIAGFFATVLVPVHPAWGLFIFSFAVLPFVIIQKWQASPRLLRLYKTMAGIALGSVVLIPSLFYFLFDSRKGNFTIQWNAEEAFQTAQTFLQQWDAHRNISIQILPVVICLVFVAFLGINLYRGRISQPVFDSTTIRFSLGLVILLGVTTSTYVVLKLVQPFLFEYFPFWIINSLIPGRFMNLHAVLAIPLLIISFRIFAGSKLAQTIRNSYSNLSKKTKSLLVLVSIMLLAVIAVFGLTTPKYLDAFTTIIDKNAERLTEIPFSIADPVGVISQEWDAANYKSICDSLDDNSQVLSIGEASLTLPMYCHTPVLVESNHLDFFTYALGLTPEVKKIVEVAYGLDYESPKESQITGSIIPSEVRHIWESRSVSTWKDVACEFGVNLVATPADWKMNLPIYSHNDKVNIYKLDTGTCPK